MPAQWTGELVGKMHNAGVTGKELAAQLGKNPKYISQVLNGHYEPKKQSANSMPHSLPSLKAVRKRRTDPWQRNSF